MAEQHWLEVESTAVKAVRYLRKEKFLDVRLATGREYRYSNVTYIEYHDLITGGPAKSIGKEFNNLKYRHEGEVQELSATL